MHLTDTKLLNKRTETPGGLSLPHMYTLSVITTDVSAHLLLLLSGPIFLQFVILFLHKQRCRLEHLTFMMFDVWIFCLFYLSGSASTAQKSGIISQLICLFTAYLYILNVFLLLLFAPLPGWEMGRYQCEAEQLKWPEHAFEHMKTYTNCTATYTFSHIQSNSTCRGYKYLARTFKTLGVIHFDAGV